MFDVSPDHPPKLPEEPEEPARSIDLHGIVDAISTSSPRGWAARYRAIGILDLHLGTPGCQAEKLLDFLKNSESTYLYLVGDIIDGSAFRRRWFCTNPRMT